MILTEKQGWEHSRRKRSGVALRGERWHRTVGMVLRRVGREGGRKEDWRLQCQSVRGIFARDEEGPFTQWILESRSTKDLRDAHFLLLGYLPQAGLFPSYPRVPILHPTPAKLAYVRTTSLRWPTIFFWIVLLFRFSFSLSRRQPRLVSNSPAKVGLELLSALPVSSLGAGVTGVCHYTRVFLLCKNCTIWDGECVHSTNLALLWAFKISCHESNNTWTCTKFEGYAKLGEFESLD